MADKVLLDTNLWVYFFAKSPEDNWRRVKAIVDENFGSIVVSVQNLGELFHVLTRKGFKSASEAKGIVEELVAYFETTGIDQPNVLKALEIHEKYGYAYWDSLLIATALLNQREILYSEDMQDGQVIEKAMRIVNPLAKAPKPGQVRAP